MARTRIEELVFKLQADSAQLRRELGLVERRGDTTATKLRQSFQGLSLAFRGLLPAISGVALVGAAREAIEYGDAIEKAAEKTTFSVEALQELRFAGQDAAGLGSTQVDTALQRFSRRIGEAAKGTGVLRKEIDRYKIDLRDSEDNLRSSEDILRDYADAVQGAESGQEQLRLAVQAFDQEGGALVNVLRQGSAGLDRFAQAAREAGAVLDREAVERLSEMQSRIDRVSSQLETLRGTFTSNLLESLGLGKSDVELVRDLSFEIGQLQEERASLEQRLANAGGRLGEGGGIRSIADQLLVGEEKLGELLDENLAKIEERQRVLIAIATRNAPAPTRTGGDVLSDEAQAARDLELRQSEALIQSLQQRAFTEAQTRRQAIDGARLETQQQQRLLEALGRGEEAYRETAIAIEVENEARRLGIDLQSEDAEAIERSIRAREELRARIAELSKETERDFDTIKDAGEDAASSLSDAFSDFLTGTEQGFDRLAQSIARRFLSSEFEALFSGLTSALPSGTLLGSVGALFGLAAGGRPSGPRIVGEGGRELFVPDVAGQIVPFTKAATAGMGGAVNVIIQNQAPVEISAQERQRGPTERDLLIMVKEATDRNIRSGNHDGVLRSRYGVRPVGI